MAFSPVQSKPKGPSQEYLLLDYLQRLGRSVDGRMAVHLHLSRLRPQHRQEDRRKEPICRRMRRRKEMRRWK